MAHLHPFPLPLHPSQPDSSGLGLIEYEVRLRNQARDFIAKLRKEKEAFNGNYLLLRKR